MKILSILLILVAAALLALAGLRTYSIYLYNQRRRRRKRGQRRRAPRKLDPLTRLMYIAAAVVLVIALLLSIMSGDSAPEEPEGTEPPAYGWKEENGSRFYLNEDGTRAVGWLEVSGGRYYLDAGGNLQTGWLELDGKRYYLNQDGTMHTGWLEQDGVKYYLKEDGTMARGKVEIDGVNTFFTADGAHILLVNPWNPVPEGYDPDLVPLSTDYGVEGSKVERSCYDALLKMINDCNAASPRAFVISSYRTYEYQATSYNNKVTSFVQQGYTEAEAKKAAATIIAVPGTSEHHLGLAVDIIDTSLWALEEEQADLPAQKWLLENSWRYGFILRYPKDKMEITGIIYEPWHYRYVGEALAAELYESGLTLEEYMESIS